MRTILFVSALVLFLQTWSFSSASLEENCRKIHEFDPDRDYDFCVASLQVVHESRTGNLTQLAIIASELTIKNYTHTLGVVRHLLKNQSLSHWQRAALNDCNELYSTGIDDTKSAIYAIKIGDFSSAETILDGASLASETCEEGFKDGRIPSLIPREDDLAHLISYLAVDIVIFLKSGG